MKAAPTPAQSPAAARKRVASFAETANQHNFSFVLGCKIVCVERHRKPIFHTGATSEGQAGPQGEVSSRALEMQAKSSGGREKGSTPDAPATPRARQEPWARAGGPPHLNEQTQNQLGTVGGQQRKRKACLRRREWACRRHEGMGLHREW